MKVLLTSSDEKVLVMDEIKGAVVELKLARQGKLKLKRARELYDGL